MPTLEWHQCTGCDRRERLPAGQRHFCDCHPAGFRMVSDSIRKISASAVHGALASMMTQRRRGR